MNINHLYYFVMTVKLGSYAAAAKSVFISPPGVSRAVGELEKELGIKLVERTGKVVKPTSYGKALCDKAIEVLNEAEDFRMLARGFASGEDCKKTLSLAISALPYRGTVIRPGTIDWVDKACPDIELSVFSSSSSSCLAALEEGVVEAAIILGRAKKDDIVSFRLFSFCPEIAASKSHPLVMKEEIALGDLLDYPIARPSDLRYCYLAITSVLEKTGRKIVYNEVFPSKDCLARFMEQDNGLIFVAQDASLDPLFANSAFLKPKSLGISIPVCFAHKTESYSNTLAIVKSRFVSASRFQKTST